MRYIIVTSRPGLHRYPLAGLLVTIWKSKSSDGIIRSACVSCDTSTGHWTESRYLIFWATPSWSLVSPLARSKPGTNNEFLLSILTANWCRYRRGSWRGSCYWRGSWRGSCNWSRCRCFGWRRSWGACRSFRRCRCGI